MAKMLVSEESRKEFANLRGAFHDVNDQLQTKFDMVRYAPHMPFLLRSLSCVLPGGMKTGIVGRTGSGLDCCQLGEEIRKKDPKLNSVVTESGENWSMGQRQLVCLGRVILKKSKVLPFDEATASVDSATDSQIQTTLRQQFSESTDITVAHRITSVLDGDMVMVLDNGLVVEHDRYPSKVVGEQIISVCQTSL